jgi:hypothetical protein
MTAHTSPHHAFPDFEPLIDRLLSLRSTLEADFDRVSKAMHTVSAKDVRLAAFAHQIINVDFALHSMHFINNYFLPLDNPWWGEPQQQRIFGFYQAYERSIAANYYNNAFVKFTFMHKLFGGMENTFRQLLRKIDSIAANNATADITGVFGALCSRIGSKPSGSDELLKLLRLSRNTYHNNGVFYSEKQTDDDVTYKGKTYHFTHGKPVDFLNWNFLIDRLDDARELFLAIIMNPAIIGIADEIPDLFSETRKTVAAP